MPAAIPKAGLGRRRAGQLCWRRAAGFSFRLGLEQEWSWIGVTPAQAGSFAEWSRISVGISRHAQFHR